MKVGCDLVYIPKFIDSVLNGGECFFNKLFTPHELACTQTHESLAGIFAAKEAFLKASGLKFNNWYDMEVYKLPSGKPMLRFMGEHSCGDIDVSISHDGDYAMAVV